MNDFIYKEFDTIFGGGIIEDTTGFMSSVMKALRGIFTMDNIGASMDIFIGVAATALALFYFLDLYNMASRDLLSLEKFVLSLMKLFVAFSLLLYARELIVDIFQFCDAAYQGVKSEFSMGNKNSGITFFGKSTLPDYTIEFEPDKVTIGALNNKDANTIEAIFQDKNMFGKGVSSLWKGGIGTAMGLLLPYLVCQLCKLVAYFMCISNAIFLIAYAIYAPIALAQTFDEGARSTGIRYLKKFAAQALTLSVILVILYAASTLQEGLLEIVVKKSGTLGAAKGAITAENFKAVCGDWGLILSMIVVQFGAVGCILKGSQIANDVLGV